ncbi:8-oxo-dGTP pyrophosphatase MutT (NUDIX family) [Metabacillus crassostreae]|uniref:NUDIX domain-containing protein n=1 Tax=Metabacillus crassostreae TaxID=929098 RepID=UPI00195C6037|nr:8-oxo-dGTP pyrophosphatase MutT (NUDIX family) [Metabacillus crassostreae]
MECKIIHPGVAVIIFDEDGRVLLQKRTDVGLWGIPSGHVEPGETVEQAAKREVFEETGYDISIERLIGVYSDPTSQIFHYPNGKVVHFITTYFLAKITGGHLSIDPVESLDVAFFPVNKLPKGLVTMHPKWLEDALSSEEKAFIR